MLFENGCVKVNGTACSDSFQRVNQGDVVEVEYHPDGGYKPAKAAWSDRTFKVVFEDTWLIVIDKTAGVLTLPTDKSKGNTLLDRLKLYLNHSRSGRDCHVIHRLDREVSGLLVFAKTAVAARLLQAQFADDAPKREFTAIVNGVMPPGEGEYESWLATASNLDQYSVHHAEGAAKAKTKYRVLHSKLDTTVVELELVTARRHQLRVHLNDAGHPVIGDPRYGKRKAQHRNWHKRRMALHAHRLSFLHPSDASPMVFESPIPNAMKKFRPQPLEE